MEIGHMIRCTKDKWLRDVKDWYPRHNKKNKGRKRRRWEDDNKRITGITWTRSVASSRSDLC